MSVVARYILVALAHPGWSRQRQPPMSGGVSGWELQRLGGFPLCGRDQGV